MKTYKALISTPLKSKVEVTDVKGTTIGDAYNKVVRQVENHEIVTVLNKRQWKKLTQITNQ